MSIDQLAAEVQRLDELATPGPWVCDGSVRVQGDTTGHRHDIARNCTPALQDPNGYDYNMTLIAHYRTAAPALAREVQRLTAERDRLRAIVERLGHTADDVPVIPEVDLIYHPDHPGVVFVAMDTEKAYDTFGPAGREDVVCPISDCYSTREAAEAAAKETT